MKILDFLRRKCPSPKLRLRNVKYRTGSASPRLEEAQKTDAFIRFHMVGFNCSKGPFKKTYVVRGDCPVWTFCVEGIIRMLTSALFGSKNLGFFEIYSVSVRTRKEGDFEAVWTRRRSQFFCDFVRTSFMDGLKQKFV